MRTDRSARLGRALLALSLAIPCGAGRAQQSVPPAPPGFRPESPHAATFVQSLDTARLMILPTIVRGVERVAYSVSSQQRIVAALTATGLPTPTAADVRIDLGPLPHRSQWEVFQGSLQILGSALDEEWRGDAEYALVMEILLPPGNQVVFGIETYILDRQGRNAFSFLLNSHHEAFRSAHLVRADATEESLEALVLHATEVAVATFKAQVDHARECATWMAAHPAQPMAAGVFEAFEAGLPTLWDPAGIPLGFSTFSDGRSTVTIDTTTSHPPRAGKAEGNTTLRIDVDVTGWAGFAYLTHEASTRTWQARDWTAAEGLSFRMYGTNSGTRLFVDVLDNRNPCSTVEDAERYVWEFTDDFSGWKEIVVPFADMVRKEVGNGAPNDGLGLDRVHGWAFGATATDGPKRWYLDDVALWKGRGHGNVGLDGVPRAY